MSLIHIIGDELTTNGAAGYLFGLAAVVGAITAGVVSIVTLRRTGRVEDKTNVISTAIGTPNGKGDVVTMNETQLKQLDLQVTELVSWREHIDGRIGQLGDKADKTNEHLMTLILQLSNKEG